MIDRRTALMLGSAGVLASSDRAVDGSAQHDAAVELVKRFVANFNAGTVGSLIDDLGSDDFAVRTPERALRRPASTRDELITALQETRKALGPLPDQPLPGQYLIHRDNSVTWFAPIRTGAADGTLPLRFEPARETSRLRSVDLTGDTDAHLGRISVVSPSPDADGAARAQSLYDDLVRAGGGTLFFAPGVHRVNLVLNSRTVTIAGAGAGVTILSPLRLESAILRATYASGVWDEVWIRDLELRGEAGDRGIGFEAGHRRYVQNDEFTGRTGFRRVRFRNLSTCIYRPLGQIGLKIDDCQFESATFHLRSLSGQNMHSGVVVVRRSHFQHAKAAVAYFDSPMVGSGQVTFEDCLFEFNPGYVLYCRAFAGVEAVPGFHFRNCWNEENATAASVTIDGGEAKPVFAFIQDTPQTVFEDTPIGDLVLRGSNVATRWCALDKLQRFDMDARSSLAHHFARSFGGKTPPGMTHSLAGALQSSLGAAAAYRLEAEPDWTQGQTGEQLVAETYEQPVRMIGSVTRETVATDRGEGQRLRLEGGDTLFLPPVAVRAQRWLLWVHVARLHSGMGVSVEVTGARAISAPIALSQREWTVLAGLAFVEQEAADISIRHIAAARADIDLKSTRIIAFETLHDALKQLNGYAGQKKGAA